MLSIQLILIFRNFNDIINDPDPRCSSGMNANPIITLGDRPFFPALGNILDERGLEVGESLVPRQGFGLFFLDVDIDFGTGSVVIDIFGNFLGDFGECSEELDGGGSCHFGEFGVEPIFYFRINIFWKG